MLWEERKRTDDYLHPYLFDQIIKVMNNAMPIKIQSPQYRLFLGYEIYYYHTVL